jgi:hypothetical protein
MELGRLLAAALMALCAINVNAGQSRRTNDVAWIGLIRSAAAPRQVHAGLLTADTRMEPARPRPAKRSGRKTY